MLPLGATASGGTGHGGSGSASTGARPGREGESAELVRRWRTGVRVGVCVLGVVVVTQAVAGSGSESTPSGSSAGWLEVLAASVAMAASTGLGAVPLVAMGDGGAAVACATAVAVGVMLAISFDLVTEAMAEHPLRGALGLLCGVLFIMWSSETVTRLRGLSLAGLSGTAARRALLLVAIMTLHSIGEGVGVGVAYATPGSHDGSASISGLYMALAIACHNIPEGLVVALRIRAKGGSFLAAMGYAALTSAPQPLVAVLAFVFADTFSRLVPLGLGFAGGCMIWVTFAELVPEVLDDLPPALAGMVVCVSVSGISLIKVLLPM